MWKELYRDGNTRKAGSLKDIVLFDYKREERGFVPSLLHKISLSFSILSS